MQHTHTEFQAQIWSFGEKKEVDNEKLIHKEDNGTNVKISATCLVLITKNN